MDTFREQSSEPATVRLCQGCELAVDIIPLPGGKSGYCPRCGTQLYRGGRASLSGNFAIAITCLILLIPCLFFHYLSIRLFGVVIPASLPAGAINLARQGFYLLALLVFFCSFLAPLTVCASVVMAHIALHQRWFSVLRLALHFIQTLKHWVMLDVFLVSVAVACFKLDEYADILVNPGLICLVALQIFTVLLLTRLSVRRYWEAWQPESKYHFNQKTIHCNECHLSQPLASHCVRCHSPLYHRKPRSLQNTWACVVAAIIALFPANMLPISIFITNGQRQQDTIFSGVVTLIHNGTYGIAIIIFIASILVPCIKIIGLIYILLGIHSQRGQQQRQRMQVYFFVKWIGKWSMMDLFVISIMMTLVDRGQLAAFTPGVGAIAFGMVVVFTMLATDSLDPRFIWRQVDSTSHRHEE